MENIETNKNDLTNCMDVKAYAAHAGKSDVAAYKQIKRDKYRTLWDNGHIFVRDGKTYLDETAVAELDTTRTYVAQDDTYERKYLAAKKDLEKQKIHYESEIKKIQEESEKRFATLQDNLEHIKALDTKMDVLINQKKNTLLLEEQSKKLSESIDNGYKLSLENANLTLKVNELEKELERERSKTWIQKLLGR